MLKRPESFLSPRVIVAGQNSFGASKKHQVAVASPSIQDFIVHAGRS
jgi:hypothetical protein